jgi:hypothetical protein
MRAGPACLVPNETSAHGWVPAARLDEVLKAGGELAALADIHGGSPAAASDKDPPAFPRT